MPRTIRLSPQVCAESFSKIAARMEGASCYGDQRALGSEEGVLVFSSGQLLEDAAVAQLVTLPESLSGWIGDPARLDNPTWLQERDSLRKRLPDPRDLPFAFWILAPHVRFFTDAVDKWLVPTFSGRIRQPMHGLSNIETMDPEREGGIAFWRSRLQTWCDACRVLSELVLPSRQPIESTKPPRPYFDVQRREFRLENLLIKRFQQPAKNQELVLKVFQEEGWPTRIEDPLDPGKRGETIRALNEHMLAPGIRFRGEGSGEGIIWELVIP